MTSVCSSSSWVQEDSEGNDISASIIKFDLPATDAELINQVDEFINDSDLDTLNPGSMLLNMARKYRFAGYIGSIHHLFAEISSLREDIELNDDDIKSLRDEIKSLRDEIKNHQRTWWSFWGFTK